MTAREPSADEVIAEAADLLVWVGFRDDAGDDDSAEGTIEFDDRKRLAKNVLAALKAAGFVVATRDEIRAMSPSEQADLIGGDVERASFDRDGSFYRLAADAEDEKHLLTYGGTIKARVVSGWRLSEVQP